MLRRHQSLCFALGLPRPTALDLDHQRPAQEGANQNQQAQDGDALKSGLQGHGAYDVGRHQDFQAQQQGFAEANLELPVLLLVLRADGGLEELVSHGVKDGPHGQDLDGQSGIFDLFEDAVPGAAGGD